MRVLLIEDDPILGESLKDFLDKEGFEVVWVEGVIEDINALKNYDAVVLDLILGPIQGEDILKKARAQGIDTPVLVLTAKREMKDKEICFNLGADDYLTKPFEPKELVLRLKALIRRGKKVNVINIGDTEIDLEGRAIYKNGKEIHISKTAWKLLELLIRNRGKVVSTSSILDYVWEDKPVGSEVVRAYIKELRKILPKDSIKTYKGIGYKLL